MYLNYGMFENLPHPLGSSLHFTTSHIHAFNRESRVFSRLLCLKFAQHAIAILQHCAETQTIMVFDAYMAIEIREKAVVKSISIEYEYYYKYGCSSKLSMPPRLQTRTLGLRK